MGISVYLLSFIKIKEELCNYQVIYYYFYFVFIDQVSSFILKMYVLF